MRFRLLPVLLLLPLFLLICSAAGAAGVCCGGDNGVSSSEQTIPSEHAPADRHEHQDGGHCCACFGCAKVKFCGGSLEYSLTSRETLISFRTQNAGMPLRLLPCEIHLPPKLL